MNFFQRFHMPFRQALALLMLIGLSGCIGGGGGGGGSGGDGDGGGSGGSGSGGTSPPADRFVVSGNSDGTLTILRSDPVAGFANAIAYSKLSGFAFRDIIHDAPNDRIVALDNTSIHTLTFNPSTGAIDLTDTRPTSGSSSHLGLSGDGSTAYVASGSGTTIFVDVYTIAGDGTLSPADSTALTIDPDYVTLNPAGDRLYVVSRTDDQILVFGLDADGSLAASPTTIDTDENPTALLFNDGGDVAYLTRADNSQDSLELYDVDQDGGLSQRTFFDVDTSPVDLVLSADGAHLYVLESGSDEVHHFSVDDATGDLTFVDADDLSFTPTDLTLSHTGAELYVSHSDEDLVTTLAVDGSDGTLTVGGAARVFDGANTVAAIGGDGALVPTATFLLAPDLSGLSIFEIDGSGGLTLRDKENATHAMINGEVAVQFAADLLLGAGATGSPASADDLLTSYAFNADNGNLAFIESVDATVSDESDFQRIELGRSGRFMYILDVDILDSFNNELGSIRTYAYDTDGSITASSVDDDTVGQAPENLTLHPAGRYIYAVNSFDDDISRLIVDATTGELSNRADAQPGGSGTGAGRPIDLKFHPNGRYAYVSLEDDSQMVRYVVNSNGTLQDISRESPPQHEGVDVEPGPIGMHPNGLYLYVGERNTSSTIAVYDINQNNYNLSYRTRIDAADNPSWIEVDPLGGFLYVRYADESVQVFTIDDAGDLTDTGQVVDAGDSGGFLPSMTLAAPYQVE